MYRAHSETDHGFHAHPGEREQEEIRQGRGRTGRRCGRGRASHPRERGTGRTPQAR